MAEAEICCDAPSCIHHPSVTADSQVAMSSSQISCTSKRGLSIPSGLPHLAAAVRRPGRGSRLCTHPQLPAHVNLYLNHLTFQIGNSTLQLPREESAHTAVSSGDLWQPVKCIYLFAEKKRGEVMN